MPTKMTPPELEKTQATAVAYIYTSSKENDAVERQRREIQNKADWKSKKQTVDIIAEFVDQGPDDDRPGFHKMIKYLKNNPVDYLIMASLDRLGLERSETFIERIQLISEAQKNAKTCGTEKNEP